MSTEKLFTDLKASSCTQVLKFPTKRFGKSILPSISPDPIEINNCGNISDKGLTKNGYFIGDTSAKDFHELRRQLSSRGHFSV